MTRTHQKHNIIDARFIDTTNSRFIDITGISVLSSSEMSLTLGDKTVHKYSMEVRKTILMVHTNSSFGI